MFVPSIQEDGSLILWQSIGRFPSLDCGSIQQLRRDTAGGQQEVKNGINLGYLLVNAPKTI